MKRIILTLTAALIIPALVCGQDLNEVIKKYSDASGLAKLSGYNSLVVEGNVNQMGMSMDMRLMEKKPGKLKMVTTFSGMDIVQVINGNTGYTINPMMGSTEPVELPADQLAQAESSSMLSNNIEKLLKEGSLELTGKSNFGDESAYEVKALTDAGTVFFYISDKTHQLIGSKTTVSQMGQQFDVETRMKEIKDFEGVMLPSVSETYVNGALSATITFNSIKFNVPIPDSEFEKK
ncbi:MAG: outer membrane lipoprotein carrier protein LolA [Bacteroidales bacterium]